MESVDRKPPRLSTQFDSVFHVIHGTLNLSIRIQLADPAIPGYPVYPVTYHPLLLVTFGIVFLELEQFEHVLLKSLRSRHNLLAFAYTVPFPNIRFDSLLKQPPLLQARSHWC